MTTDIIIIAAGFNSDLIKITQNAIDSCYNSNGNFRIIVIETFDSGINYENCETFHFINKNFNYNRACNYGLSLTSNDIVGIFNNDIIFSKNWFSELKKGFKKFESLSPFCENSNKKSDYNYVEGYTLRDHLNGWAIVFKRSILKIIKKLNQEADFWFADNLFAEQLKQHGIKHALCTKSIVNHIGNGSNTVNSLPREEKEKLTYNQIEKFRKTKKIHNYNFSIIMPSFLGYYKGAAKKRGEKFARAVNSVINQTFKDWELIIVSDGCDKTVDIFLQNFSENENIRCFKIPKQPYMSGTVRQKGIEKATGEIIIYLDSDDVYKPNHLEFVANNFVANEWVFFNDIWKSGETEENIKTVKLQCGISGTSSIAHKRLIGASWFGCDGYGHDWTFIQKLMNRSNKYKHIGNGGYCICHVPGSFEF